MNKYLKYTIKIIAAVFILIIISFTVLSIYVSSHKKTLIAEATEKIGYNIGGKISIADIGVNLFQNFPYISISIDHLKVTDSLYNKHGHALIQAEKIFVRLNPLKLITLSISVNKLTVKNGAFFLYTDTSGYTNSYLLKANGKSDIQKTKDSDELKNLLDKIDLQNVTITIDDQKANKLFDFLINQVKAKTALHDSVISVHVNQDIFIKNFSFKKNLGTFLENQVLAGEYDFQFYPKSGKLQIDSMPIKISNQSFLFKAIFEFRKIQNFYLDVKTADLKLSFAKTLLTKKIAGAITKMVDVSGPLKVHTIISGSLIGGGDPYIKANFESVNSTITTAFAAFDSANFKGSFLNENVVGTKPNDENTKISIHDFVASMGGFKIKSDDILIINLNQPYLSADLHSDFDVNDPEKTLDTQSFTLTKGSGKLDFMFEGPLNNPTPLNTKKHGILEIKRGQVIMTASNAILNNCNARIRIDNSDINIDTLQCNIAGSPITIWGKAKNVLALIGENPEGVELELNAYASLLNIDHLSSIVSRKYPVKKRENKKTNSGFAKTIDRIDALLSNGRINVNIKADKLKYHSFEANKLVAKMQVDENFWSLQQASLVHGKGSLLIKATVQEAKKGLFTLSSKIDMKNLDAKKIMGELNNFGLKAFTSKNIQGTLSLKSDLSLNLTKKGDFDLNSLQGKAGFSVKNGALVDFDPIKNLEVFLFKKRDFGDIKFAEIKDDISFKKGEITIGRMEINSSVLTLFVEGIYGPKNTDISIQVPLSNLKNRKNYQPENIGVNKAGGLSVFLRARADDSGKINIKYDPFKRFRKPPASKEN